MSRWLKSLLVTFLDIKRTQPVFNVFNLCYCFMSSCKRFVVQIAKNQKTSLFHMIGSQEAYYSSSQGTHLAICRQALPLTHHCSSICVRPRSESQTIACLGPVTGKWASCPAHPLRSRLASSRRTRLWLNCSSTPTHLPHVTPNSRTLHNSQEDFRLLLDIYTSLQSGSILYSMQDRILLVFSCNNAQITCICKLVRESMCSMLYCLFPWA